MYLLLHYRYSNFNKLLLNNVLKTEQFSCLDFDVQLAIIYTEFFYMNLVKLRKNLLYYMFIKIKLSC